MTEENKQNSGQLQGPPGADEPSQGTGAPETAGRGPAQEAPSLSCPASGQTQERKSEPTGAKEDVVGVVVVTHGYVCGDLVSAAEAIVGPLPRVVSVPTDAREPAESIRQRVTDAVAAANTGRGVLILTDLHGSTPANACAAFLRMPDVEVLFGVNLPMLIKLSTCDRRFLTARQLGQLLLETGRRSIRLGSEMLRGPEAEP